MPRAFGVMYTSPFPCSLVRDNAGNLIAMHKRAVVSGAAADLSTFISGGYPTWTQPGALTEPLAVPGGVVLSVESGTLMVTLDGTSVPTATLGTLVPVWPATLTVIGSVTGLIKAFSTSGTVNVQCYFLP